LSASAPSTLPSLRLRAFGGLTVDRDGSPASGAGSQRRPLALLAQLAATGERGLSRAKLVGLLWPDSDEEKARRVLAQTLYSLRRDLGAEELVVGTTELRLNGDVITTDVGDFIAAADRGDFRTAASLYAGPFLDGFYLPGAAEFERWVDETRTALAHRYIGLVEELAEESERAKDATAEVAWRRRLANAEPLSARHCVGLMRALVRAGDRGGAMQHARIHEALMRAELDADPDPEVVAFATQLKSEPEKCMKAAPGNAAPSRPSQTSPTVSRQSQNPSASPVSASTTPATQPTGETPAVSVTQEWMVRMSGGTISLPGVPHPGLPPAYASNSTSTPPSSGASSAQMSPADSRASSPAPAPTSSAPARVTPETRSTPALAPVPAPSADGTARVRRRRLLVAAGVVAILAALGTYFRWLRPAPPPEKPAIAFAGVTALTPDTSITWLAEGLPQMVAAKLFRIGEVEVVPPPQVREVMIRAGVDSASGPLSLAMLRDIARRVGANVVATGQLARQGAQYVLHVAVYDVASGRTIRMSEITNPNALLLADAAATQLLEAAGQGGTGPSIGDVETTNVEAYRAYLRARQAADEGRHADHIRNLDLALSLDSGFIAAVSERLSVAVGDNDQATIDRLRPLFARYASRATEWDRMSQELDQAYADGEHERAEALGARLVARFPRDPHAYQKLHVIYMMHGRFDQAERVALSALALDSLGIEAGNGPCVPCTGYMALTDARLATGNYAGALTSARRWVALQPGVPSAWMNRARVALALQQFDTALALARRAQIIAGGGDEYWEFSVRVLLMARRYADADTAIATAMASQRRGAAFDMKALLERERGQLRASNRTVDQAAAEVPGLYWLKLMKANTLGRLGSYDEAARLIESMTHPGKVVFPLLGGTARGFAWHHALEADILAPKGDTVRLRSLADSVEVGGSRSYYGRDWRLPHHIRGQVALAGHRYDEAIRELTQALWTRAGWTRTNVELARAYLAKKQPGDAVAALRGAYEQPLDAMARYVPRSELDYWMALSFHAAGQMDSARVYASRARESWAEADPEVKRMLGDLSF